MERGVHVLTTARQPGNLINIGVEVVGFADIPTRLRRGALVLHSIPPSGSAGLIELLGDKPSRVVYLSSTAVYGSATSVDETTPVDPSKPRARERLGVELSVTRGPWSSLILRPAAIYGPGRGAHERVRRGEFNLSDEYVSRIHVDDLATLVEAGMLSEVTGAWPVADEQPCSSREITEFSAALLGVPVPANGSPVTRRAGDRRVDGSAIRKALGIALCYPTYRAGIPAALASIKQP